MTLSAHSSLLRLSVSVPTFCPGGTSSVQPPWAHPLPAYHGLSAAESAREGQNLWDPPCPSLTLTLGLGRGERGRDLVRSQNPGGRARMHAEVLRSESFRVSISYPPPPNTHTHLHACTPMHARACTHTHTEKPVPASTHTHSCTHLQTPAITHKHPGTHTGSLVQEKINHLKSQET